MHSSFSHLSLSFNLQNPVPSNPSNQPILSIHRRSKFLSFRVCRKNWYSPSSIKSPPILVRAPFSFSLDSLPNAFSVVSFTIPSSISKCSTFSASNDCSLARAACLCCLSSFSLSNRENVKFAEDGVLDLKVD